MAKSKKKPLAKTPPQGEADPLGPPVAPMTAPTTYVAPVDEPSFREKYGKYMPSRKWGASTVGGIGTVGIMWATTGTWDVEETVAAITLTVTAISTWMLPNKSGDPNEPENI
jgi:hypothetical protein